jgi:hypothetical protein
MLPNFRRLANCPSLTRKLNQNLGLGILLIMDPNSRMNVAQGHIVFFCNCFRKPPPIDRTFATAQPLMPGAGDLR